MLVRNSIYDKIVCSSTYCDTTTFHLIPKFVFVYTDAIHNPPIYIYLVNSLRDENKKLLLECKIIFSSFPSPVKLYLVL